MKLKKQIIENVERFFNSEEEIEFHFMKLLMWYSKCEEDMMELSLNNHDEFKKIIPKIVDIIISDFKRKYKSVNISNEQKKTFINRKTEIFNKKRRFNVHLTISDFDLIMDSLDAKYRKIINTNKQSKDSNIQQSKYNLNPTQENILSETKKIFDEKKSVDFIEKRKLFLHKVFPKIEELYRIHPSEFEDISTKIHSIMYKQEVSQITSYLKNQEFRALQTYKSELADILRTKYVSLENTGNRRLCKFLLDYEDSIQNWMNGENGSRAILKDTNKDNGHCYIATMAYGDYNHPSVIKLRNYRDNSLNKNYLGQKFIKIYYQTSPILVQKIKNNSSLNKIIKLILDKIVEKLK
mgnify:CR=1 FL=1